MLITERQLRENGAVIAMFLDASSGLNEYETGPVRNDQRETSLLNRDIQSFRDKAIHALMPSLSETFSSWLNSLRSVAEVGNSASTANTSSSSNIPTIAANQSRSRIKSRLSIGAKKIQPPRLSTQVDERIAKIRQIQISDLPTARNKVAVTAANLLATRADAMERMIVLLERTKYGSLSRGTKARADYLATVAECMSYKVQYVVFLPILLVPVLMML
jgi:diphthamide biosynthesis protein 3